MRLRFYAVTKNGESKFWQPIGAMWAHTDAKDFNLWIDYLPLNDAEIVVRVAGDKQAKGNGGLNERPYPPKVGSGADKRRDMALRRTRLV